MVCCLPPNFFLAENNHYPGESGQSAGHLVICKNHAGNSSRNQTAGHLVICGSMPGNQRNQTAGHLVICGSMAGNCSSVRDTGQRNTSGKFQVAGHVVNG